GVIVPDVANPFFTLVVRGVEQVAWRAAFHVILCDTQGDRERERGSTEDMVAFQVDGVLIAPVADSSRPQLRLPTSNNVPFLTVMAQPAETFGTIATQLLIDRLAGRVGPRRRIVVLPADFVVRKSSGVLAPERAEAS